MATDPQHHNHEIPFEGKAAIKCITSFPSSSSAITPPAVIFTHGAGGSLDSEGILNFRTGFARHSPILCYQGSMNLPSRVKMFDAVISHQSTTVTAIGGRSMGSRAAVMVANERPEVKSLVLVSYPLHTGKGDVRDGILMEIESDVKVLFVVGDRDSMCDLERLEKVRQKMKAKSWLVKVEGADHGMGVKPKAGTKLVGEMTGRVVAEWLGSEGHTPDEELSEGRVWWDADEEAEKWSGWAGQSNDGKSSGKNPKDKKNAVVKSSRKNAKDQIDVDGKSERTRKNETKPEKKGEKSTNNTTEDEDPANGEVPKEQTKQRGKRTQRETAADEEPKKPTRKRRKA